MLLTESQCCPPISFFQEIMHHDILIIERHENYQKRSYRNRFYLNSPQGKFLFSIPLAKGKNEQQKITNVSISYDEDWIQLLSKIMQTNYSSAPYYEFYIDEFMDIMNTKFELLIDLNYSLLRWILKVIGIDDLELRETNKYEAVISLPIFDYRNKNRPNQYFSSSKSVVQYGQVFEERNNFIPKLSIIDMIFCCGPETLSIIKNA